jgi:hypothetical protein
MGPLPMRGIEAGAGVQPGGAVPRVGAAHPRGVLDRAMTIVADAYEVGRRELLRDARTAWTWQGPADDLVVHLAGQHGWSAELTVSYLAALRRARLWNRPDRGW